MESYSRAMTKDAAIRYKETSLGVEVVVDESTKGLRTLYLDGHVQSEVQVLPDGTFSKAQPLELVQLMSLFSLGWLAGNTAADPGSPNVLLIGIGGGSITNVLMSTMPAAATMHSLDLIPGVVEAAHEWFGMPRDDRCTSEAADGAEYMRSYSAQCKAGEAAGYDVLILDAFTPEGLSNSTQRQTTLDDAALCLTATGMLLLNLHTGDKDDPDYYIARRIIRGLCSRFDSVYSAVCATTQNQIVCCHNGDFLDAGEWEERLDNQLDRQEVFAACLNFQLPEMMRQFEFEGGKADMPREEKWDVAKWGPQQLNP